MVYIQYLKGVIEEMVTASELIDYIQLDISEYQLKKKQEKDAVSDGILAQSIVDTCEGWHRK